MIPMIADLTSIFAKLPLLKGLPILPKIGEFLDLLRKNRIVIVEADTGSGKSTGLAPILVQLGLRVLQTQPRELAAQTVGARIAQVLGVKFGEKVGYRTGSQKSMDGPKTDCLVVTDGLAMVRRILQHERNWHVLMLDEVHEWNKNIETLIAWIKKEMKKNPSYKVVIMSATMESDRLSQYFDGAPVLRLPGRCFPIEDRRGYDVAEETVKLLREGRNVLVFQPGKAEIDKCMREIERYGVDAEMLALHAEMTADDQARCFKHYGRPKCIVATNVAQTSITIDDMDAVVDSGMEKRTEVVDGVEGIYLRAISKACGKQRRGRIGRTKDGIYVDCCPENYDSRPDFPVPEIQRTLLDQMVLKLASMGVDMESLEFFHQPPAAEIHEAKRVLTVLGCMDEALNVTEIGHDVARFPIKVQQARMIVEAAKRGVVDEVLTIAAILDQGGITAKPELGKIPVRDLTDKEEESDPIAQLNVFEHCRKERLNKDEMIACGVHVKKYFKAVEQRRMLVQALPSGVRLGSTGDREQVIRSVVAGMVDNLFHGTPGDLRGSDTETVRRQLTRDSVVRTFSKCILVGKPWDYEKLRFLTLATKVNLDLLLEVAPHLLRQEEAVAPYYDEHEDCVHAFNRTVFNRMVLEEDSEACPDHPEASNVFAQWCLDRMAA